MKKTLSAIKNFMETLADPRAGTYYNKEKHRHECVAIINGKPKIIGWYLEIPDMPKSARMDIEKKIWAQLFAATAPL